MLIVFSWFHFVLIKRERVLIIQFETDFTLCADFCGKLLTTSHYRGKSNFLTLRKPSVNSPPGLLVVFTVNNKIALRAGDGRLESCPRASRRFFTNGQYDALMKPELQRLVFLEQRCRNISLFGQVRSLHPSQRLCRQGDGKEAIPFARGRVRSRKIEEVLREVETLAAKGYKEVVLTGIHLSSYGVDFPKEERESLLSLIQAVSRVEGISRIRLGSLEPRIITEEFLEGIVKTGKVCPHFHLSLQSGCNKTLKNMNRRYSAQEYAEKCELIRKFYPAPALTTDVIVGFPQETEEDFEESYEFVKKIHFYETHIFKYSRRHGTKAASMDGQLTEAAKAQRSDRMLELHEIRAREYEEAMIGKKMELLLEEEIEIDGRPWYVGHSREYVRAVISKTDAHRVNDLVTVKAVAFVRDHILETKEV